MLFQKIVTISGKTYRELNETNLRGPRKHCADTSIKKSIWGVIISPKKEVLGCSLCSSLSWKGNLNVINEKINLNLFFQFQFIHTKDHEIMQSKLWLLDKVKFSLDQISFKAVHKSSPLLNFCLFNLRQSHLCSFLVQLLIFLPLFSSAIFCRFFYSLNSLHFVLFSLKAFYERYVHASKWYQIVLLSIFKHQFQR